MSRSKTGFTSPLCRRCWHRVTVTVFGPKTLSASLCAADCDPETSPIDIPYPLTLTRVTGGAS